MRRLAVSLAAACSLLFASPALATVDVDSDGTTVTITGTTNADAVTVEAVPGGVRVSDTVEATALSLGNCTQLNATQVECDGSAVTATLADGSDTLFTGTPFAIPITAQGGAGNDILIGGDANDTLDGNDGIDLINGAAGDDQITGGNGADTLSGGDGRDRISGNDDDDLVSGDAGDDSLDGNDGEDFVSGGDDSDELDGGGGDDAVAGDEDSDIARGGAGDDTVSGDTGNDQLDGGDGADTVSGDEDDDTVRGGAGVDTIAGGAGGDLLDGGANGDSIEGDEGIDRVTYASRSAPVTITLGNGVADDGEAGEGDEVGFSVENATAGSGADQITGSSLVNAVDGGPGDDTIELRDQVADTATCGAGSDTVHVDNLDHADADCETVDNGPAAPSQPPAGGSPQVVTVTQPARVVISPVHPRVSPRRVTLRVGPARDRRAPYTYRILGRLTLPAGTDRRRACGDVGFVSVQVHRGAATLLALRPRVRSDCTFAARVNFRGPRRLRTTRLRFTASFLGNAYISPARAKSVIARAG